eukprot:Amastigsp_a516913_19.p3 type:complete len:139 gc:universal Amastigsp_a516913_19:873-1289(+)
MIRSNDAALAARASRRALTAGKSCERNSSTAAMCIAVGNASFDDCDMLTWSFGCTGFFEPIVPPSSSIARFEMTSLTFMFVWVPDPVWKTTSGKWSSRRPSITSSAAATIASEIGAGSPNRVLTIAAAFLRIASAWTT